MEFSILERTCIAGVNLARYFRLGILNYSVVPCLRMVIDGLHDGLHPKRMPGRGRVRRQERRLPAEMQSTIRVDSPVPAIRATISLSRTERPDSTSWNRNRRRTFGTEISSASRKSASIKCVRLAALRRSATCSPAGPVTTLETNQVKFHCRIDS